MADEILTLNNDISKLRAQKEALEQRKAKIEGDLEGSSKNSFEEKVIISKILLAVHNLNHRCEAFNTSLKKSKKKTKQVRGPGGKEDEAKPSKDQLIFENSKSHFLIF